MANGDLELIKSVITPVWQQLQILPVLLDRLQAAPEVHLVCFV